MDKYFERELAGRVRKWELLEQRAITSREYQAFIVSIRKEHRIKKRVHKPKKKKKTIEFKKNNKTTEIR